MTIVLCRVDERLIHGQVTVGWGTRLRPDRYVVVDDVLAESDWQQEIYRLGVPEEAKAEFLAAKEWERLTPWSTGEGRTIVLTRDLEHMLRLASHEELRGAGVNLGGIYFRPGRVEVLPYLFLDDSDRARIRALVRAGTVVFAQDLPGARRWAVEELRGV